MQDTTPAETETTDPKRRYLCRHIFIDGHRCGSPSLRGESLCYNHGRVRRENGICGRSGTFPMPRIDDRASIQLALYEVLSRLAGGDIEYKRGAILLRGLAIASSNLPRHAPANAEQQPQVEEVTADYHLGDLAPIAEIPDTVPQTPAQEPPVDEVVILSGAKNPRIQPGAPQTSSFTDNAVTPSEAPGPSSKNTNVRTSAAITRPVLAPQPLTLAAVQATAHPQPATDNLQLPTPPRYTKYTHDSHPRMAP
jgi:hypothetical protein